MSIKLATTVQLLFVQSKISVGEDIPNSQLLRLIEGEEPLGILLKSHGVCVQLVQCSVKQIDLHDHKKLAST